MQKLTRRNFVMRVGQAGGFSAAYLAMQGLGMIPVSAAEQDVVSLKAGSGKGVKVVILGAGMAGLSAGYELKKAGYEVTLLEARDRVGGHAWTIRPGTKVEMTDSTQTCEWADGHYMNCGPARLPSHHQTILGYCRELGVPLEVEVNSSRSAYLYNKGANGGKPMLMREAVNDTRGHVSELLAKAVNQGALDKELTGIDKEKMVSFLRQYGDLSPDLFYKGSTRSGYKSYPGAADEVGEANDPLSLNVLLDQDMWQNILFEDNLLMQATMFQPVGGMDQVSKAIGRALGSSVKQMSEVKEIRRTAKGVRIVYVDKKTGTTHEISADYCVSTIPLPVLAKIPADFSEDIKTGIAGVQGGDSMKIAFESRRFWEQDYQVYGGLSFAKSPSGMLWHPSYGYHTQSGVLTFQGGVELSPLPLEQQHAAIRTAIDGLYPGHGKELSKPIVVQWSKVPYNMGTGARFSDSQKWLYTRLNQADGPFYFAADYLAHLGSWQEGAARSGHHAVRAIDERVQATKPA